MRNQIKNLVGRRFSKLTVVAIGNRRGKRGEVYWLCKCDCGNTKEILGSSLTGARGDTRSCGCLKAPNGSIKGKRFGRLIAVAPTSARKAGGVVWECLCDCGNTTHVPRHSLINGGTRSCGCLAKEHMSAMASKKVGKLSHRWNPELTDEERHFKRCYKGYEEWRLDVFRRDDYICAKCGKRNGKHVAHHIENHADNKDIRLVVGNGATLCEKCHFDFHKEYGYKHNDGIQFAEWLA